MCRGPECLLRQKTWHHRTRPFVPFLRPVPSSCSFVLFLRPVPSSCSFVLFLRPVPSSCSFVLFLRPVPSSRPSSCPSSRHPQHPVILANARTQPSPPITLGPRLRGDDGKKKTGGTALAFHLILHPTPRPSSPNTPSSSRTRGPHHHHPSPWVPACAGMTAKNGRHRTRFSSHPSSHPSPVTPQHPVILANARTQPSPPITLGPRLRGDDGKKEQAPPHSPFFTSLITPLARHPPHPVIPNTPSSSRTQGPNHHRRPRLGPRVRGDDGKKTGRLGTHPSSRPSPRHAPTPRHPREREDPTITAHHLGSPPTRG